MAAIITVGVAVVPINVFVIRNISVSDSSLTVQIALSYSGSAASNAQFTFVDKFPIVPTTNVSITSVAALLATKRGVSLR